MSELITRIFLIHDTEEKWNDHPDFIPQKGEVVIYDIDSNYTYERFKIGDGVTKLKDLPFTIENVLEKTLNIRNNIGYIDAGRITDYK